jgi:hypothetical protein
MSPKLVAVMVVALAVLACGTPPMTGIPAYSPPATLTPSPISPPTEALIPWQGFPADHIPRPVVLIGNSSPHDGFNSGDAKIAYFCHKFTAGTTISKAVPNGASASWHDGTATVFPAISAAAALAAMMKPGPGTSEPICSTVQPLVVSSVRLGGFESQTDRGVAQIYAWLFTMSGANGDVAYPAIAPPAIWNVDLTKGALDGGSFVSADGRTLTFSFWGTPAGTGPCSADYTSQVAESHAAVAVAIRVIPPASPVDNVACPAIAQQRTVTVALATPLGGRVVVNATGAAEIVCPASLPRGC